MTRTTDPKHKFLRRLCKRCGEMFLPKSKYNYICPECIEESGGWWKRKNKLKKKEGGK